MVNGAGLAMATMDMVESPPTSLMWVVPPMPNTVEAGFRIIFKIPESKSHPSFGGIVRCDSVAQGVMRCLQIHR